MAAPPGRARPAAAPCMPNAGRSSVATRLLVLLLIAAALVAFFASGAHRYFSFENLKAQQASLEASYHAHPVKVAAVFFLLYVTVTSLSVPGAAVLTLVAGAIFGLLVGALLVSFASALGATIAFLASRFVLRDWVRARYATQLQRIDRGVAKEGALYLFTLRLIPAVPYFLINLAMGLTAMRPWTFYWVSQLGMLAATLVYANAGTQLAAIDSPSRILSPGVIGALVLLGLFPLVAKKLLDAVKARRVYARWPRPRRFERNLIVIGGGSAGPVSAYLAAGARPLVPPLPGIERARVLTSDTVWELRELPQRLVVLGGGPIGCELAQAFARFGARVTQVEMLGRLLAREDPDVSQLVRAQFAAEGIDVRTAHRALRIDDGSTLVCEHKGAEVRLEFDALLCALGRVPNTAGYGLEELGIAVTKARTVDTDDYLQTLYPNIYACGDVAGPYQFTHTASHQAWYASVNALFAPFKRFRADYSVIPWATFTDPEVARVGLNETEANERGVAHEVTVFDMHELDRAIADEVAQGMVKVLTVPGKDRILGATLVGEHAGDLIVEFITAMKYGIGLNKILGTIHIYPTLAEASKYAAGAWKRAHAPQGVLKNLERVHAWRRG